MIVIPDEYQADVINLDDIDSPYVKWALKFFTDKKEISDPYLSITLDLDITPAYAAFNKKRMGASFTAVMMYALMRSIGEIDCFLYRYFGGQWCILRNPPLMMPVAVGGAQRFVEVVFPDVLLMEWADFANAYNRELQNIKTIENYTPASNENTFKLSQFIGNLPKMRFSGFKLHAAREIVQNIFYFGERHRSSNNNLMVPFAMNLHHANADPLVGQALVETFQEKLLNLCKKSR
jgi:chloramphenicol O-acetyltransferase